MNHILTFRLNLIYILLSFLSNSDRAGGLAEIEASYTSDDPFHSEIGVVSVLFELSDDDNPAFEAIFSAVDKIKYPQAIGEDDDCQQQSFLLNEPLNLEDMIPVNGESTENGYFSYEGSLTTSPCTANGLCCICYFQHVVLRKCEN